MIYCGDLLINDYGEFDRVGIVEKVENGTIYTMESNSAIVAEKITMP